MALEWSWMIGVGVFLAIAIIVITLFVLKTKNDKKVRRLPVSNLKRVTLMPEYQSALKRYQRGLYSIVGLLLVGILTSSVIMSKPVAISVDNPDKYNRDIVLCLDASGSTLPVDLEVISIFKELVSGFKGERISLVVWNSSSHMVFPLTDDYPYVEKVLGEVQLAINQAVNNQYISEDAYNIFSYIMNKDGGSLIGDGVTACSLGLIDDTHSEDRSKSIILASDNIVNGVETISFMESAEYAAENDITIYGLHIISGYEVTGTEADEMRAGVELTGGSFYSLDDADAVEGIVTQISEQQAGLLKAKPIITKTEAPQIWILGSGLLVLIALGLMWRYKV